MRNSASIPAQVIKIPVVMNPKAKEPASPITPIERGNRATADQIAERNRKTDGKVARMGWRDDREGGKTGGEKPHGEGRLNDNRSTEPRIGNQAQQQS